MWRNIFVSYKNHNKHYNRFGVGRILITQITQNMSRGHDTSRRPCIPVRRCGKVPGQVLTSKHPRLLRIRVPLSRSRCTTAPRLRHHFTPSVVTVKGVLIPGTHSWQLFRSAPTPSRQRALDPCPPAEKVTGRKRTCWIRGYVWSGRPLRWGGRSLSKVHSTRCQFTRIGIAIFRASYSISIRCESRF